MTAAWRGIKHKKALILPLLILFKLMKLKLWIVPIFLAVHFIKKILVIASILLPILFTRLKICKVSQPHHQGYPHHLWTTAAEAPIDYPSGINGSRNCFTFLTGLMSRFVVILERVRYYSHDFKADTTVTIGRNNARINNVIVRCSMTQYLFREPQLYNARRGIDGREAIPMIFRAS